MRRSQSHDPWADWQKPLSGEPADTPEYVMQGCMKQFAQLKKQHRHLKVLLSIGGWNNKDDFKAGVSTSKKRSEFANSSVKLVQDLGFDGIDIDWEYPKDDTDATNLVELLKTCRLALDQSQAKHQPDSRFLLTLATPADPQKYKYFRFKELNPSVDHYNFMGYDYAGSFSQLTAHSANLFANPSLPNTTPFSTDKAIKAYIDLNVNASMIILGMPLHGHGFNNTDGLGKAFAKPVKADQEHGFIDYRLLPMAGPKVIEDMDLGASYSYDSQTREFISYDTPNITAVKTRYVMEHHLGG